MLSLEEADYDAIAVQFVEWAKRIGFSTNGYEGPDHTYYHKAAVEPGAFTAQLLAEPMVLEHNQVVEVFADAIQSLPETATEGKWRVTITDGVITGG